MRLRNWICLIATMLACGMISFAQDAKPTVKREPAAMTSPASGKEMFVSYCAACHGKNGKGDGPAAAALKQPPADLTMLAKRNGGKYPSDLVTSVLRGQARLAAHGDQDMPVWGPVFWHMSQGKEEQVTLRIANLNRYVQSLQEK
ncbi:MAG: cytochrome c [Terriglobales bacterium]